MFKVNHILKFDKKVLTHIELIFLNLLITNEKTKKINK